MIERVLEFFAPTDLSEDQKCPVLVSVTLEPHALYAAFVENVAGIEHAKPWVQLSTEEQQRWQRAADDAAHTLEICLDA